MIHLHILVADDSEPLLQLVREILTREGHAVTTVTGGREALRFIENETFDLVIADVIMADGDGFELVGRIRLGHPATRILIISGGGLHFTPAYCTETAEKLGAHAALMKPFTCAQLLAGVATAMGG